MTIEELQDPELFTSYPHISAKSYLRETVSAAYNTPSMIEQAWRETVERLDIYSEAREHVAAFMFNTKMEIIGWNLVSVGSIDQCVLDPKSLMRPVILSGCASFCLAHNHPSGDTQPSNADISITERVAEAGKILNCHLKDHIIIGNNSTSPYSFAEKGGI